MCVAALAWHAHPDWWMIAVGNRDEFHERPSAPLSRWDDDRTIAGRDLQAGGTWLGVSADSFGLVTNLRVPGYPKPDLLSRGSLVTDWLREGKIENAERMNPFNLWCAHDYDNQLVFQTNYPKLQLVELGKGIHGLSNGPRGDRWFKTERLEAALTRWFDNYGSQDELFAALRDETPETDDPEDAYSPIFIRNPVYGTRCSTVVMVGSGGNGLICERRFDAGGEQTGETTIKFGWAR